MNLRFLCLLLFIVANVTAFGQTTSSSEGLVVFDPLFWKDQLKLDDFQCKKIKAINSEYYHQLSVVVNEEPNRKSVQRKAEQSLLQRSEEIWETFHPRQRKRWKKMWQENYLGGKTNDA